MTDRCEGGEALALQALVFLTEDGERLTRFLDDSGVSPAELRRRAGEPDMLGAVLDYVLQDESLLLVFAANAGIDPLDVAEARAGLPGGDTEAQAFAARHHTSGATGARLGAKRPSKRWAGPDKS